MPIAPYWHRRLRSKANDLKAHGQSQRSRCLTICKASLSFCGLRRLKAQVVNSFSTTRTTPVKTAWNRYGEAYYLGQRVVQMEVTMRAAFRRCTRMTKIVCGRSCVRLKAHIRASRWIARIRAFVQRARTGER